MKTTIFVLPLFLILIAKSGDVVPGQNGELLPLNLNTANIEQHKADYLKSLVVYGRFISGEELELEQSLLNVPSSPHEFDRRNDIYLLTCTRYIPGKANRPLYRIDAEVELPNKEVFRFLLVKSVIDAEGCCWNLVQVLDRKGLRAPGTREAILRSTPSIVIRNAEYK